SRAWRARRCSIASRCPRSCRCWVSTRILAASDASSPTTSPSSRSEAWSGWRSGGRGGGMRAEWTLVCVLLVACGTAARLTRPEGNGGWSPDRRAAEVAAHVDPTVPAAAPPAQPLTLAAALELAAHGNRRVAEAEDRLAESRERVWQT